MRGGSYRRLHFVVWTLFPPLAALSVGSRSQRRSFSSLGRRRERGRPRACRSGARPLGAEARGACGCHPPSGAPAPALSRLGTVCSSGLTSLSRALTSPVRVHGSLFCLLNTVTWAGRGFSDLSLGTHVHSSEQVGRLDLRNGC